VVNLTGTSYTDTGLVNGMTYYYVVSAGARRSQRHSAQVSASPVGPPPCRWVCSFSQRHRATDFVLDREFWSVELQCEAFHCQRRPYSTFASPTSPTYTDSNVAIGPLITMWFPPGTAMVKAPIPLK